jgi:hypothetical protein
MVWIGEWEPILTGDVVAFEECCCFFEGLEQSHLWVGAETNPQA